MTDQFFERPILNSPYAYPARHWELDADGQPTQPHHRDPPPLGAHHPGPEAEEAAQGGRARQAMVFDDGEGISSRSSNTTRPRSSTRSATYVDPGGSLPNPDQWQVTPETARLLQHWRSHAFQGIRPFFCQIEAVETAIWLTEVAPQIGNAASSSGPHQAANEDANPELLRLALKLATGAGKTTVIAMLIAWQTINAVRHPGSKTFHARLPGVAPGITIRDRLRVLLPNDPDSYYRHREIVPPDMLGDIDHAKIVITNYHAFKLRERLEVAKGTRAALEGWRGEKLQPSKPKARCSSASCPT